MGLAGAELRQMADLVNDGALLRNQEQQQKAERFEHLSHSDISDESRGQRGTLPERGVFSKKARHCGARKTRRRGARIGKLQV
jgi:hypothetical protein